jgi:hypothetical protein
MSKQKYAMANANGMFVKDFDYMTRTFKFTPDLDRAMLYTPSGIEEHLPFLESHNIDLIRVEIRRVGVSYPKPASEVLDEVLARFEEELTKLNEKSGNDVDNLSDEEFRRWKRLKRMIENRTVDKSAITT